MSYDIHLLWLKKNYENSKDVCFKVLTAPDSDHQESNQDILLAVLQAVIQLIM